MIFNWLLLMLMDRQRYMNYQNFWDEFAVREKRPGSEMAQ